MTTKTGTPEPARPISAPSKPASTAGHTCVRCNKNAPTIRALCTTCDRDLAVMHWSLEHIIFRKLMYMPDKGEAKLARDAGFELRKPPHPSHKSREALTAPKIHAPNEALTL